MLNKEKARPWVKLVAWVLAISFALSMTLLLVLPTPGTNQASTQSPKSTSPNTPLTKSESKNQVKSALGQGDLAKKNDEMDQAIIFYEKAYKLDKENTVTVSKLSDAYFSQAQKLVADDTDTATAKTLYNKYLDISPDGEHSDDAKTALEKLE